MSGGSVARCEIEPDGGCVGLIAGEGADDAGPVRVGKVRISVVVAVPAQ